MAKKETIQFKYDSDKLKATRMTMEEKGMDFDSEIMETVEKLYEKYVPNALKKFIESEGINNG